MSFRSCKTVLGPVCCSEWLIPNLRPFLLADKIPFINRFVLPYINEIDFSDINCRKLNSFRLLTVFYNQLWLIMHTYIITTATGPASPTFSWSGFISALMPRGGLFALTPACYYFGCISCWLVRHSRECAPESRTTPSIHLLPLIWYRVAEAAV